MNLLTSLPALARVVFDGASHEEIGQLTSDLLALYSAYQAIQSGQPLGDFSESQLNSIIPALSRTGIVLGDIWGDATKQQDIINALKGL